MKPWSVQTLLLLSTLWLTAGRGLGAQSAYPTTASKQKTCRIQLRNLGTGLEAYRIQEGQYPSTLDARVAQKIVAGPLLDPWGHPFELSLQEGTFDLRSRGSDNRSGTPDDLVLKNGKVTGGLQEGPALDPLCLEISQVEHLISQRNWGEAALASEGLLTKLETALGPVHPKTIRAQLMAGTAAQWGNFDLARAEALFRKAVAGAEALVPSDALLLQSQFVPSYLGYGVKRIHQAKRETPPPVTGMLNAQVQRRSPRSG